MRIGCGPATYSKLRQFRSAWRSFDRWRHEGITGSLIGRNTASFQSSLQIPNVYEFAPSTIPPASQRPSALIAVVPFAMSGAEQYRHLRQLQLCELRQPRILRPNAPQKGNGLEVESSKPLYLL
jgi:hypothetical protein